MAPRNAGAAVSQRRRLRPRRLWQMPLSPLRRQPRWQQRLMSRPHPPPSPLPLLQPTPLPLLPRLPLLPPTLAPPFPTAPLLPSTASLLPLAPRLGPMREEAVPPQTVRRAEPGLEEPRRAEQEQIPWMTASRRYGLRSRRPSSRCGPPLRRPRRALWSRGLESSRRTSVCNLVGTLPIALNAFWRH